MTSTRIQIYTMQSVDEALAVAALGVDHLGVTPSDRGLPGEITSELAAKICRAARGSATTVALSVDVDLDAIVSMVTTVRPDILHLCGPMGRVGPREVIQLRRQLPDLPVMQAIAVTGPGSIDAAQRYAEVVDFLILDSVDPSIEGVGAAGVVHDWTLSAEIITKVGIPVILAGGLSRDNVAEAIATVHPWGVDSLTATNKAQLGGGFRKDLSLVAGFVESVRGRNIA